MDDWMGRWMDSKWMDRWIEESVDGWGMGGWMGKWMDDWMDGGWVGEWMLIGGIGGWADGCMQGGLRIKQHLIVTTRPCLGPRVWLRKPMIWESTETNLPQET